MPWRGHLHRTRPSDSTVPWNEPKPAVGSRPADVRQLGCRGGGKSLFACAGAQGDGQPGPVDLVIATTLSPLKINLGRFYQYHPPDAAVIEGTRPSAGWATSRAIRCW